ncbi:MAG: hypothetical protein Q7R85_04455 [bacterium]|nr:hypothetical protein [bacterium]
MSIENPFSNPPQETPGPEEEKQEQPARESVAQEQGLSAEQIEQYEQYEQYVKDHPETVIAPENLRECGPEIAEYEEMLVSFESAYSLAELHLIIDLKPEDAANYPLRESAKAALVPIVEKMNILKKETNIAPEKREELKARYERLSKAVGIINNNKVDHTR